MAWFRFEGAIVTAAIYFHPEAYSTAGPKLMGRNAAGESFLRGLFAHSKGETFYAQVAQADHGQAFAEAAKISGRKEPVQVVLQSNLGALQEVGASFHPGPGIGEHAWQRGLFGHDRWSLCGITHTTSSARAMDAIIELVTAPVQPWDALICTSNAVKSNVERLLQAQVDYLVARLGIAKIVMPQMPVIPLGIHTGDFVFSDKQREAGRKSLGADSDTMVVLFMGRLSFHAKAHPLAMYQALEMASAASGKKVILVECGWHANDHIRNAFSEAAAYASPNVTVVTLDGRNADSRTDAWASADVFCSLSDNIQETFGITPIEAMAAGLPLVVADWDGYKDTVRQEVDGFRIPTLLPQPGLGNDLSSRHALGIDTYDLYCGNACMLSAVDIEATASAFTKLFSSPDLRARMGQAGRDRARSTYDWANIIPQYETLWENLSEIRRSQGGSLPTLAHAWPARMDPFYAFATYPTQALTAETVLELGHGGDLSLSLNRVAEMRKLAMVRFTPVSLADDDEIATMLAQLAGGTMKAADVVAHISEARRPYAMRSLVWLAKLGVVRAVP